ncbi:probable G-protein coupled receptor AH9.1 [Palaemon carinicauda]|uniref:probable G-protein coupled receptor AH9.1 n=1 Tax=Palaemon carinicauda TaxID=392227 RepID=UPI0035B68F69
MYDYEFNDVAEKVGSLVWEPQNDTVDQRIEETRFIAYSILAPIIVIVGIVGNLLTIFVLRLPQFRGVTYTLFLVLAISDLLSLFFSISLLVHLVEGGTRHYSTAAWYSYCEGIFTNGPMSTSTFIIILITVDRYFSVCRPAQFKTVHTNRNARIGIVLSLAIALIAWGPSAALKEPKLCEECTTTSFEPPDHDKWWVSCMKSDVRESPWYIGYSWARQAITIFLPAIILVVLNSLIVKEFVKLRRKKRRMMGEKPKDSPVAVQRRKDNQHLIHLLAAVTICFFVTTVPSGIFGALYDENLSTKFRFELFRALANDLEILNHAINFYLYILYSKQIRDAIVTTIRNKRSLGVRALLSVSLLLRKTGQRGKRREIEQGENDIKNETDEERNTNRAKKLRTEVLSDNESSFNRIVAVKELSKAKLLSPNKNVPSDTKDNTSYFEYPLRNQQQSEGNVYQRAVMNHMNKPPNGLHTIVHTAEVHKCQSPDDSGPLVGKEVSQGEDKVLVKKNGHIPNEKAHLTCGIEPYLSNHMIAEEQNENQGVQKQERHNKNTISTIKDSSDGLKITEERKENQGVRKQDRHNKNTISTIKDSSDGLKITEEQKENQGVQKQERHDKNTLSAIKASSDGLDNLAFQPSEISEHDVSIDNLSNGIIRTPL